MGEFSHLIEWGSKLQKNGLNQGFFEYLECDLVFLFGPTNNKVQADLPSGILMLCR